MRRAFKIVCRYCEGVYQVALSEKEFIKGRCPTCATPITVGLIKGTLCEKVRGVWKSMRTSTLPPPICMG